MDDMLKNLKARRFELMRDLTRVQRAIRALEPSERKASAETRQKMSIAHRKPRGEKARLATEVVV